MPLTIVFGSTSSATALHAAAIAPSPMVMWSRTAVWPPSTTPAPSRHEPASPTCPTMMQCGPILHVVADLDQVVDLGAPTDARGAELGAIDADA